MTRLFVLIAVFVTLLSVHEARSQATFDDLARFVAGQPLSPGSTLRRLEGLPSVRKHTADTAALTKTWYDRRLNTLRDWAKAEIHPRISRPKVVKYPFGGPDFVHATTLFPGADEYILVGLEPVGTLPDFLAMDDLSLNSYLSHLNHTLRSISQRNFFITTEMREDFGKQGVDGVYAVLLYFASMTKHEVLNGQYVRIDASGNVVELKNLRPDGTIGEPVAEEDAPAEEPAEEPAVSEA